MHAFAFGNVGAGALPAAAKSTWPLAKGNVGAGALPAAQVNMAVRQRQPLNLLPHSVRLGG